MVHVCSPAPTSRPNVFARKFLCRPARLSGAQGSQLGGICGVAKVIEVPPITWTAMGGGCGSALALVFFMARALKFKRGHKNMEILKIWATTFREWGTSNMRYFAFLPFLCSGKFCDAKAPSIHKITDVFLTQPYPRHPKTTMCHGFLPFVSSAPCIDIDIDIEVYIHIYIYV